MFFKPPSSAYFLSHFPLVPPLKNFRKWPILVSLLNLPELGFAGTFGRAVCVKMFSDDCTLSEYQLGDRWICAGVFFKPPSSAYFLSHFPLVPPLKNFRKWPILVSLLNLPELGFAGTFGRAVCVKMFSDDCTLSEYQLGDRWICGGVFFKPPSSAYFLSHFPLVPPLKNFRKWPILVSLLNLPELGFAGTFGRAVCVKMFSDDCTLSEYQLGDRWICGGVFFKPPSSAYFLNHFPLVPPLKNFRKWPILVSLLNLPELGFAGTFGRAVCVKMFSDDCTLSEYQLGDRWICGGVFFKPPSSAYFLNHFPLVPPLKNFRKWPILVSLLNLPELGFAGTFGRAVCVKMFSDDCTLSEYQLGDRWICGGVFFKPPSSAYFLNHFPLVPPLKNFRKWPILVFLLNLPELGFAGTFGRAVCVKMFSDDCTLSEYQLGDRWICGGVFFKPPRWAYFLNHFPLVPPLKNFRKWPILVFLLNLPELGFAGTFGRAVCVKMFSDDCTLSEYQLGDRWICGGVFFKPPRWAYFLNHFPLVPPLKNFRKWPILVFLLNLPELGFAGTFGRAVCVKMFSDDCTLSEYQLGDRWICGGVFFKPPRWAYFLNHFPLVPPLKNFRKWPILVFLLNLPELGFAGTFGRAVCVKMFSDDCTLSEYQLGDRWICGGVFFKPPRWAYFLNHFPLVPPLKNFRKWPILVFLLNLPELGFAGTFGRAVCVKMFSDDCTLSEYQLGDRWICGGVFFKPPRWAYFLNHFPLVPPLKNFRKWPILVFLLNLPELGFAGTFGRAVCVKMFSDDCTLSEYQLGDRWICGGVFFKPPRWAYFLNHFPLVPPLKNFRKWPILVFLLNLPELGFAGTFGRAVCVKMFSDDCTLSEYQLGDRWICGGVFFKPPRWAYFLNHFPLVPPLKNFRKWPILVFLLNLPELGFAGTFGRAVCVKMFSDDCTLSEYQLGDRWICGGVFFKPPSWAYFLNHFPLVPPLKNFRKWPILVFLLNLPELGFAGTFGRAVCVKMFSDDCTLSEYQLGDRWICGGVFFKPPRWAYFLNHFPLVPPLKNFRKWPILVFLLNLPELGFAGTFGRAVCVKMFSDDCTLSEYQLGDRWICGGVFFKPPSWAYFLNHFPLVPPLKNFRKWPILVFLLNLPELGFAGTFGRAVCVKMFSDDCTLSEYQLGDRWICGGVFFKPPSWPTF